MTIDSEYITQLNNDVFAGCDEVGRGPIAGPVVAATVAIDSPYQNTIARLQECGITDSKKLSAKKRRAILSQLGISVEDLVANQKYSYKIQDELFHFSIREISPTLIDEINILNASLKAMTESAVKCVGEKSAFLLVDGNRVPQDLPQTFRSQAVVKGDSKSVLIGLASIIAKEFRDNLMEKMDQKYPGYGFAGHAGYPTVTHLASVKELGPCPIHRRSFKGVKEYI